VVQAMIGVLDLKGISVQKVNVANVKHTRKLAERNWVFKKQLEL